MYRYTSVPSQHASTNFHPFYYPHKSTATQPYITYMSRLRWAEPHRSSSYYEASFSAPSSPSRPVDTNLRRNTNLEKPLQQQDHAPRRNSLKDGVTRHVHFDLPASDQTTIRVSRKPITEEDRERERASERSKARKTEIVHPRSHHSSASSRYRDEKMPTKDYLSYSHHHYTIHHHHNDTSSSSLSSKLHMPPPISPPYPSRPTVYIITYATDLIRSDSATTSLLSSQVPHRTPPIPHLYTIDARSIRPPSASLCDRYSGISPLIQDIVMEDACARQAVSTAVKELLRFGEEENRRERRRRGSGQLEVSLGVCCHAGTHRSVAIAERIAQWVKAEVGRLGCEEGVMVVCRHVHRIKGRADPF